MRNFHVRQLFHDQPIASFRKSLFFSNFYKEKSSFIPREYSKRLEYSNAGQLNVAYNCAPHLPHRKPFDIHSEYSHIKNEVSQAENIKVSVHGRILVSRVISSKLAFLDLYHDGVKIQVVLNERNFASVSEYRKLIHSVQRGDIISCYGTVMRTTSGELSVMVSSGDILTPCLRNIPDIHAPKMTEDHKSRWRHLDMIATPSSLQNYRTRSKIISIIRKFLESRQFLEVETPILASKAGGALAKPFETKIDALDLDLSLRVAPELYLKRLLIGGFDRVFEIGKVFRNEGIDATHNPEFTSLEMYQSFSSMESMMTLIQTFLPELALNICDKISFEYQGEMISFKGPYKIIEIVPSLEVITEETFDLNDHKGTVDKCISIIKRFGIQRDATNASLPYLFDKLIGHFLEPLCIQPTFLVNHPIFMSPLARAHPSDPNLSHRFELFIACKEIANGYSELNDPHEQRKRFIQQQVDRSEGNPEAHLPDEDFVECLEVGMPPTAGCGIGIDRLVMLLTNKKHIRDVLLFPLTKPFSNN